MWAVEAYDADEVYVPRSQQVFMDEASAGRALAGKVAGPDRQWRVVTVSIATTDPARLFR